MSFAYDAPREGTDLYLIVHPAVHGILDHHSVSDSTAFDDDNGPVVVLSEARMSRHVERAWFVFAFVFLISVPAFAHHEAMFGPQSSAVLSPGIFLSAQVFDRENGRNETIHRETTTVFSVGVQPSTKRPLSLAFVIPFTFSSTVGDLSRQRFEDALISARY